MIAPRLRFGLNGSSQQIDLRVNAVRGDLADVALAGRLFAPHYAAPVAMACTTTWLPLLDAPGGSQESELLSGEHFMVLDLAGGLAWGWCAHDHYVGYANAASLAPVAGEAPAAAHDPVDWARAQAGMPYVWGGRGGAGIDCSGLVQRALAGIGIAAPRDSDMQQAELGRALGEGEPLARGDLIFFTGHVGMMADEKILVHATRHHGKVIEESLSEVATRIAAKKGAGIVARKRVMP